MPRKNDDYIKNERGTFLAAIGRAHRAGVKIVVGLDLGSYGVDPKVYAREFAVLVEAGLSPMESIQAGTRVAAELLQWDDRLGTLQAGKLADIIGVPGNPLTDMSALERVSLVMIGGKLLKRPGVPVFLAGVLPAPDSDQRPPAPPAPLPRSYPHAGLDDQTPAGASLAGRRHLRSPSMGFSGGGWMGGFPIVVGPILLVTTLEQGAGFGVSAAQAALLTIGPTALFLLIFAHLSLNRPWWQSALPAYAGWGLVVGLISLFPLRSDLAAGSAVAGLLLAEIFMPTIPPRVPVEQKKTHPGGLAAKMVVGVFLIFVTTAVASAMGPRVAGYAAAFP